MLKKTMKVALSAGIIALAVSACSSAEAPASSDSENSETLEQIAIGVYPSSTLSLPAYIGESQGIFEDNGLDVELIDGKSGPELISGLIGGTTQVTVAGAAPGVVAAIQQGQDLRGVAPYSALDYTLVTTKESGITSIEGLVGHRVAVVARGAAVEMYVKALLIEQGLDPESVEFVASGPTSGQIPLVRKGDVEAVVLTYTSQKVFEAEGLELTVIADPREGNGGDVSEYALGSMLVTTGQFADESPDTMKRICSAFTDVSSWMQDPKNLDEGAALLAEITGLDVGEAGQIWPDVASVWAASLPDDQWQQNVKLVNSFIGTAEGTPAELPQMCS